uniref:FLYWCH-type domain-containing protein n=1 Tax=Ditylenchus dipsaci TaxID=166011 RepID=A0A915E5E4_9BILA
MEIYDDEEIPTFCLTSIMESMKMKRIRANGGSQQLPSQPEPEQLQFVMSKKGRDMVTCIFSLQRGNGDVVYSCKHHRGGCMAKVVLNNTTTKWRLSLSIPMKQTCGCRQTSSVSRGSSHKYGKSKISPRDVYNQAIENLILDDSVIAAVDYENIRHLIARLER